MCFFFFFNSQAALERCFGFVYFSDRLNSVLLMRSASCLFKDLCYKACCLVSVFFFFFIDDLEEFNEQTLLISDT